MQRQQSAFAAALLDSRLPVPAEVIAPDGRGPAERRFAVYRNNVVVSLVEALMEAFPACCALVGEDFFRATARAFAVQHPPRSPVMMFYGDGFDCFLRDFGPTRALAFLPDVARIELACRRAYHAADTRSLGASDIAGIDPGQLEQAQVTLSPSLWLYESDFPALDIWRMARGLRPADPPPASTAQRLLVVRPQFDVLVEAIDAGALSLLRALQQGRPFGSAVAVAFQTEPDFDLAAFLASALRLGLFTALNPINHHAGDA